MICRRFNTKLSGMLQIVLCGLICAFMASSAHAAPQQSVAQTGLHILADSPPYHLQYDKNDGAFVVRAYGGKLEQRYSVTYLHTDAGPTGYSKHLAWFLARDASGFSVLWCYLDDSGKDFWCWLYRYPDNVLTTQHFTGEYTFAEPSVVTDTQEPGFTLPNPPPYNGPDFTFLGWTRKSGVIDSLPVYESITTEQKSPIAIVSPDSISKDRAVSRTLGKIQLYSRFISCRSVERMAGARVVGKSFMRSPGTQPAIRIT